MDDTLPMMLQTDASLHGIGAILMPGRSGDTLAIALRNK